MSLDAFSLHSWLLWETQVTQALSEQSKTGPARELLMASGIGHKIQSHKYTYGGIRYASVRNLSF